MSNIDALLAKAQALTVLRAMAELGQATPAELAATTGMPARTLSGWRKQLEAAGLLGGTKHQVLLTELGRAHAPRRPTLAGAGELDQVLEAVWPTEYHRAFIRLLISSVLARWHLRDAGPAGHLGFVATGATGTGKSAMGKFVAQALGLDPATHTLWLPRQTGGSLLGRRTNLPGGGVHLEPAPHLGRPLVVLEEADKQDERSLVRSALSFLQGELVTVEEGARLEWLCTPLMTANVERTSELLPDEYVRRCAVLNTHHFASLCDDLPARLRQLDVAGGPPVLDLEQLRPPVDHLDDEAMAVMAAWLDGGGIRSSGRWEPALEAAALGRAALAGSDDLAMAATETAIDFLTVGDTIGRTAAGWSVKVNAGREAIDTDPRSRAVLAAFEQVERHRRDLTAEVRTRRVVHQAEDLDLTRARAELVHRLETATRDITQVPAGDQVAAAGIRSKLKKLREKAGPARTAEALADLEQLAGPELLAAHQMRTQVDLERATARQAAEQQRRQEQDQVRQAKEFQRQQRVALAAQRKAASAHLDQLRRYLKNLEQLWTRTTTRPGEDPLTTLRNVRTLDGHHVLTYQPPRVGQQQSFLERALVGPRPGTWQSAGGLWPGTSSSCPALAEWGPDTRAALLPLLRAGYAQEDDLERAAGRKPRANRLHLQNPSPRS